MKTFSKIFFIMIFLGVFGLFIMGYLDKKELEKNQEETICKYSFCKYASKSSQAFFKYYINGRLYRNSYGGCPDNSPEKLNKFYVLYYSKTNPNKIMVDFSKEVKDQNQIKELESKLTFKYWMDH